MSATGVKRKKKSYAQRTMKFFKKGSQGKGVRIDDETFEYFLHVLKVLNQEFESEDDKKAFVENVFEQLNGNEVNYSCNQVVSRIVDNLLPFASKERLNKFMDAFDENLRPICMDQFASFVFQKLMSEVTERYIKQKQTDPDSDEIPVYRQWMLKTFKYVLNNLDEFMFDHYANHIMRTAINCIVGNTKNADLSSNELNEEDFVELLENFTDRLLKWSQFSELPFHNLPSGCIQVLLKVIRLVNYKKSKSLCKQLLNQCFISEADFQDEKQNEVEMNEAASVPSIFDNAACIRLLEVFLSVASSKTYTQVYAKCFINKLVALAQHREANFAVQKLIKFCKEKVEFEAIFDELSTSFESTMNHGCSGVILQLCEACIRFKTKQSVFMQLWMNYLECGEPKESQNLLSVLTVYMKKRKDYDETQENNVNLQGSLLVQNMLKFNKPIKVVNSILEMKSNILVSVFCNPKGCHIADAFFDSEFVGEKSREKFIKIFQGSYASLTTSKHGSRVFDIIWKSTNVKNRSIIAQELLENESKLEASPFGRPIIYNISLAAFRHSKEDWIKAQGKEDKAKKLFSKIL